MTTVKIYKLPQNMLGYEDEVESQKGVELLKRVRNRHRDVNKEIEVTLILARHFSGRADEAVTEYATVADRLGGLANDPYFLSRMGHCP